MLRLLRKIHRYAYIASVLFFFALGYPFLLIYARNPQKNYRKIVSFRKWIGIAGIYAVGIRVQVDYETDVDWSKTYIICPNHTSFLDISVLTSLCKAPFSFMGKEELLKNPVTRIFFETIDIPVRRDNKISSFKAFKKAVATLLDQKSLVIFPEGKIDDNYPPILHPFKPGAFRLATDYNIAILPVVIQDAWKIFWDDGKKFGSHPGVIHVNVLAPIETNLLGKENVMQLEREVYNKMKDAWDLYNKS